MTRRIEISLGNVKAIAELLEEEAPQTCEMIWKMLPINGPAMHSAESGREVFVQLPSGTMVEPENQTIYEIPSDVFVYYKPVIFMEPKWPVHERVRPVLGWVYEKDTQIQSYPGGPLAVNLFARIVQGIEKLGDEAPRMRREGFGNMMIKSV
jgi:hypothetical protein